jgi:hypothetical protein
MLPVDLPPRGLVIRLLPAGAEGTNAGGLLRTVEELAMAAI